MVELQIITKILEEKDSKILVENNIDSSYFHLYAEELDYILSHEREYGNVPDKATVYSKFEDLELEGSAESDRYLVKALLEEHTYFIASQSVNKIAEIMLDDSHAAVDFMLSEAKRLTELNPIKPTNIIADASKRYEEWIERQTKGANLNIETGFEELDKINGGFNKGEELVLLFAKTGQGKSWVLIKMLEHAWKQNYSVGLIEPEMSASKTGYRFDTLNSHIPNSTLNRGKESEDYEKYIEGIKSKDTPFYVATPKDFGREVTVSKIRNFCIANKIEILGIDGVGYLKDERRSRGENRTTELTHIGEDLMDLSIELGIPVIMVHQSNRQVEKGADLSLDNVRESDGLNHTSSLVVAVQQTQDGIRLGLLKNRNGKNNIRLDYTYDIDRGIFSYVPNEDDGYSTRETRERIREQYVDEGEADF